MVLANKREKNEEKNVKNNFENCKKKIYKKLILVSRKLKDECNTCTALSTGSTARHNSVTPLFKTFKDCF